MPVFASSGQLVLEAAEGCPRQSTSRESGRNHAERVCLVEFPVGGAVAAGAKGTSSVLDFIDSQF